MTVKQQISCHDCGALPGQLHANGCDVERCPVCGGQVLSCGCDLEGLPRMPWTGEFPDSAECREYGLYAKLVPGRGWIPCDKNDPEATDDLNALVIKGTWNIEHQRWILPRSEWRGKRD